MHFTKCKYPYKNNDIETCSRSVFTNRFSGCTKKKSNSTTHDQWSCTLNRGKYKKKKKKHKQLQSEQQNHTKSIKRYEPRERENSIPSPFSKPKRTCFINATIDFSRFVVHIFFLLSICLSGSRPFHSSSLR